MNIWLYIGRNLDYCPDRVSSSFPNVLTWVRVGIDELILP
jgi:hypothetical protein